MFLVFQDRYNLKWLKGGVAGLGGLKCLHFSSISSIRTVHIWCLPTVRSYTTCSESTELTDGDSTQANY